MSRLLTLICLLLALPVLGVLGSWFFADARSTAVLIHQASTVWPEYAWQTGVLAVTVSVGVAFVGGGTAAMVSLFDFPGRRWLEWALLLPMAMPAYVLAYAYTDFLQFSGPVQSLIRQWTGWHGALWPDVRSLWGATALFVLCLYPYVYLLARAALVERGAALMEAARMLGAPAWRRVTEVALPMARPALMAGIALALMETLADYGVGSYFGLQTFSTGIYKAWLVMNDRDAAAQLASLLLVAVAGLLWLEHRAQQRMRFAASRGAAGGAPKSGMESQPVRLQGLHGWVVWAVCSLPLWLGFVIPVLILGDLVWQEAVHGQFGLPLDRFWRWSMTSFGLAAVAALLASVLAAALALGLRWPSRGWSGRTLPWAAKILGLGYAVPGSVIAVGMLWPIAYWQQRFPDLPLSALFTGTLVGVMVAYLVRFSSAALQSVQAGYARINPVMDETAKMLGADRSRVFWQLHRPLLLRATLTAALLVFVDVMKELPATLVLRPFDSDTLAVMAYQLARDERLSEAALPSLAIVLVGLLPVYMLSRALRPSTKG